MQWAKPFLIAIGLLAAAPAHAQTFPERGRAAVVDAANVIPDGEEAALAARLTAWERETGHQLVVATVPGLQGYDIADYSNGLFRHWRLGRAGVNDGVLLLLAPAERRVRIEVGYGLEPVLTDVQTIRIIRETIQPALRKNAPGIALSGGADRIMEAANASGPGPAGATPARLVSAPPQKAQDDGPSVFTVLLLSFTPAFVVVLILVWLYRRGRKPLFRGPVRPLSKRAQRRRAAAAAAAGVTWDYGATAASSSYSSWDNSSSSSWDSSSSNDSGSSYSSDSGGFDSGGGSSGGGGSDSSY
jgi:uncharacterized protein